MAAWLASSRRFAAFVSAYQAKIRKKIRSTQGEDGLHDLWLELETAYLLLQERLLTLAYELQDCGQVRCPDFAVTYTTSLTFMVEVTRTRLPGEHPPESRLGSLLLAERLIETVCSKLGQLLPRCSNILVIGIDVPALTQVDLRAAMLHLQQRAERNDPALWERHPFRDRANFFQQYQRLSEMVVRGAPEAGVRPVTWVNPQARHPLPGRVRTALYRSQAILPGSESS